MVSKAYGERMNNLSWKEARRLGEDGFLIFVVLGKMKDFRNFGDFPYYFTNHTPSPGHKKAQYILNPTLT